jgi:hypothetical protein
MLLLATGQSDRACSAAALVVVLYHCSLTAAQAPCLFAQVAVLSMEAVT